MIVKKIVNMTCTNGSKCAQDLLLKLKISFPNLILEAKNENSFVNGHISISHIPNEHKIWVCVYENDNVHESEYLGKLKTEINTRVRKMNGKFPTKDKILEVLK